MIRRVFDEESANICDNLLTKLILDERQYDSSIDSDFRVKEWFKNKIKDNDNILLCYEEDNIIKGYIFLKLILNDDSKEYLIDGLYVEEDFRRQGIASKLIKEALDIVKESDINFVNINVLANNLSAISLYKSFGFDEFKISMRKEI